MAATYSTSTSVSLHEFESTNCRRLIIFVLYQLVCPSKAANEMMLSHLIGILRQACTKNKLSDIMGLLVFIDGMFLQILKGEEGAAKDLMFKNIHS